MSQAVKEKAADVRRSFDFENDDRSISKYFLGIPTSDQIRKADWHYSKIYNKALVDGVSTEAEMMDILRQRKIYSTEYEQKLHDLQIEIGVKINTMEDTEDELVRAKLALEVRELRDRLYQWNQRITGPLSNTCERMADDAKMEFLTSVCLQKEDGSSVWDSYDDFAEDPMQRLAMKARFEVLLWMQGLESDFMEKTPEQVVLNEIAESQKGRQEAKRLQASAMEAEQMADEAVKAADEAVVKRKRTKKI